MLKCKAPQQHQLSCINEQSHEAVLSRADTLLKQLRSNPSATTIKNSRRRRKHVGKARDYQRNIVVVDYAGAKPPAVQVLHDYDEVYEGTLQFNSSISEECIGRGVGRWFDKGGLYGSIGKGSMISVHKI
jgi:hypothetical protein